MADDTLETNDTMDTGIDVAVEVGDGWSRRLTITVAPERVARARAKERKRLSKSIRLKGFRKGRVPGDVVEQRFGTELDQIVQERLIEDAYREAIDSTELQPAGAASVSNVQYAPGERLTFQAEVEIMPTLELSRIGGFRLKRETAPVTDEEVRQILDRVLSDFADWREVERKAAQGDLVAVRVAPLAEGEDQPDEEAKPYRFVLGSGQALPDVEKAITTLGSGESGAFLVEFPGEGEDAAPEARRLFVAVDAVEEQVLPELDDDLVKRATGGAQETAEDLEQVIRADLARHHAEEAEGKLRGAILEALIDANSFTLPGSLIDRYLDGMLRAPEGADPAELRQARESLAPHAERQIKEEMILDRLIEREGLRAGDEEVDARIEELAERSSSTASAVRRQLVKEGQLDSLKRSIEVDRAFEYLKSQSEIEDAS
ncbi:MAG: trigger factor [marine benthic group bacterium]|nr:trigger factor [Gemmatimonadota bacterium]